MNKNQKQTLLETAIDLLNKIDVEDTETVDIDSTKYDDGSSSFTVTVNYPIENNEIETEVDKGKSRVELLLDKHQFIDLSVDSLKPIGIDCASRNCDSTETYRMFSVMVGEKYCREQSLTTKQFDELVESLNDDNIDYVMFGEQVVCREEIISVEKV